jgi:ubiquitin C-terminal hydrolase
MNFQVLKEEARRRNLRISDIEETISLHRVIAASLADSMNYENINMVEETKDNNDINMEEESKDNNDINEAYYNVNDYAEVKLFKVLSNDNQYNIDEIINDDNYKSFIMKKSNKLNCLSTAILDNDDDMKDSGIWRAWIQTNINIANIDSINKKKKVMNQTYNQILFQNSWILLTKKIIDKLTIEELLSQYNNSSNNIIFLVFEMIIKDRYYNYYNDNDPNESLLEYTFPLYYYQNLWKNYVNINDLIDVYDSKKKKFYHAKIISLPENNDLFKVHLLGFDESDDINIVKDTIYPLFSKTDDWRRNIKINSTIEISIMYNQSENKNKDKQKVWKICNVTEINEDTISISIKIHQNDAKYYVLSENDFNKLDKETSNNYIKSNISIDSEEICDLYTHTTENNIMISSKKRHMSSDDEELNYGIVTIFFGLFNFGCTCYMNAVVQVLLYVLKDTFFNAKISEYNNNIPLTMEFNKLLNMKPNINNFIEPTDLRRYISNVSEFSDSGQHDAYAMLNYFIDTLKQELNTVQVPPSEHCDENINNIETYCKEVNNSIIIEEFGIFLGTKRCCTFNHEIDMIDYQAYFLLSLPTSDRIRSFNLIELIQIDFADETIDGAKCAFNNCQSKKSNKKVELKKIGKVVTFAIGRGDMSTGTSTKNNNIVLYPEEIDLSSYLCNDEKRDSDDKSLNYNLFAIIEHTGDLDDEGHYITYIKDSDTWYLLNDTKVKKVGKLVRVNPYILFYRQSSITK